MIKLIEKPLLPFMIYEGRTFIPQDHVHDWFEQNVEPINGMLGSAVKVYGYHTGNMHGQWLTGEKKSKSDDTHTAYLINIEPIKRESAEDLLKFIIRCAENGAKPLWFGDELLDRAKAVLGE